MGLITITNMIFLIVHLRLRPFHRPTDNSVETGTLSILLVASLLLTMFPNELPAGAVVLVSILVLLPLAALISWIAWGRWTRAKKALSKMRSSRNSSKNKLPEAPDANQDHGVEMNEMETNQVLEP